MFKNWKAILLKKIPVILTIAKLIFLVSVAISFISLLLMIFSDKIYYFYFEKVTFLEALPMLCLYGTFYIIIFLSFPASIILLIVYIFLKFYCQITIDVKVHLKLIIYNILILTLIVGAAFLRYHFS